MAVYPTSAVAGGEVGLMADENAQRLCSIFAESAISCLRQLHEMSSEHGTIKAQHLYIVGLQTISTWNTDILREEVLRLELAYPELRRLHSYVYLSLVEMLGVAASHAFHTPQVEDTYHAFMKRVASAPDVTKGSWFFDVPQAHRRCTFVESLRNAVHDMLRRHSSPDIPVLPEGGGKNRPMLEPSGSEAMEAVPSITAQIPAGASEKESSLVRAMRCARGVCEPPAPSAARSDASDIVPSNIADERSIPVSSSAFFFEPKSA